ncbi:hypothetical protein [Heyndrickxia acidiproducens]|jgi:hypothetical protein|nr:hypothetical protein [Heyndrickxia acidiproducens]
MSKKQKKAKKGGQPLLTSGTAELSFETDPRHSKLAASPNESRDTK